MSALSKKFYRTNSPKSHPAQNPGNKLTFSRNDFLQEDNRLPSKQLSVRQ
jgi:hypothetical protein